MRIKEHEGTIKLWLSARDTYEWAHRDGANWPCSTLADKRLFVEFQANGDLVDLTINGNGSADCDANELNAITSDLIRMKFPNHPAIR